MAEKNRVNHAKNALEFILEEGDQYLAVATDGRELGFFKSAAPLRGPIVNVNDDGSLDFIVEYYFSLREDLEQGGVVRISWEMFLDRCTAAGSYVNEGNHFETRAKCKKTRMPALGVIFVRNRKVVGPRDRYVPQEAEWWRAIGHLPGMGFVDRDIKSRLKEVSLRASKRENAKKRKRMEEEAAAAAAAAAVGPQHHLPPEQHHLGGGEPL